MLMVCACVLASSRTPQLDLVTNNPCFRRLCHSWYQSRFGVKHYINKLNLLKNAFFVRYELVAHIRTILEEY